MKKKKLCKNCKLLILVKLNPELSSQALEEARATLALSLFLLAAKKNAFIVSFR